MIFYKIELYYTNLPILLPKKIYIYIVPEPEPKPICAYFFYFLKSTV